MRILQIVLAMGTLLAGFIEGAFAVTSPGRAYQFGFRNGNLIRNWSFETFADNWFDESSASARLLAKKDGIAAVSGAYVAKYSGQNNTGASLRKLTSEFFPIVAGTAYSLSMFAKTSSTLAGTRPVVIFYGSFGGTALANPFSGSNYPTNIDWTLLSFAFTPPSGANFAQVVLAEIAPGQTGTAYFDDIVLEEGTPGSGARDSITEEVAFFNDNGQTLQSFQKISGGGNNLSRKQLVSTSTFDYQLRLTKSYLPFVGVGNPDFDTGFAGKSKSFNNGSNGRETSGDFPFESTVYSIPDTKPTSMRFMSGTAWNTSDNSKAIKSGFSYTNSLVAPNGALPPSLDENEGQYLYNWSKDVEGRYTVSWSNATGQVVQTAFKPVSTWKYTRYQYFPDGKLKKILQDSDNPADENSQHYREVTNFNALGEMTSSYSKDRGLRKFWYNRLGQIRYSQHESQPVDEYDYTSYDSNDRPYSMGIQMVASLTPAMVEARNSSAGTQTEHRGIIYDNLTFFQARTGLLLSDIMPGKSLGINGEGRVVCEYNLNRGIQLASLSPKDKFVATFYNYNAYGEVTESYKFIGAVKDASKRIHKVSYQYDNHHRMFQTTISDNAATPYTTLQKYGYDPLGRVNKVTGASGKFYSSYAYYDWGGLKSVTLGGSGTASNGTRIDFKYNAQGWAKEIKATRQATNEIVFQQFLGYEAQSVASANLPPLASAKYDGSISQQLVKFAKDVESASPIRVVTYKYDNANRMIEADARKNSGAPPWDANQQIIFGSLQWTDTEDLDSRFTFDDKGRIETNQTGVPSTEKANYYYQGESYKLDHASGKFGNGRPRDASRVGTFVFDARGRMVGDSSKGMSIRYGWDDMPIEFAMDDGDSLVSELNFYDAGGSRVSRLFVKTERKVWVPICHGQITFFVRGYKNTADVSAIQIASITDVGLLADGDRRWTEMYGSAGQITAVSGKSGVMGIAGQIGELNDDGTYRFFVKNHQGSVLRSVGDNGEYLDASGTVVDFRPYGTQEKLKVGAIEQVQSYTGKELESALGLYAFGARWYDPELGMWMSPDPKKQFSNPYQYGSSPPNFVDPDGQFGFAIAAGIAAGIFAAAVACSYIDACSDKVGGFMGANNVERAEVGSNGAINITMGGTSSNPSYQTVTYPEQQRILDDGSVDQVTNSINEFYNGRGKAEVFVEYSMEQLKAMEEYEKQFGTNTANYNFTPEVGSQIEKINHVMVNEVLLSATNLSMGPIFGRGMLGRTPKLNLPPTGAAAEIAAKGLTRAERLLRPGGNLLGEAGTSRSIRILDGGKEAAQKLFSRLVGGGVKSSQQLPNMTIATLEEGGTVTFRTFSRSGGAQATIDVNIPGIGIREIKLY